MSSATQPIGVIARLLDLSERRVQQLSREGVIPKAERGQYDLVGSVRGYVRYLRDQAVRAQAGAPDYAAERARFIEACATAAAHDGRISVDEHLIVRSVADALDVPLPALAEV